MESIKDYMLTAENFRAMRENKAQGDMTEFNKLEEMLKEAGIKYCREDSDRDGIFGKFGFHQLRQKQDIDESEWDVIFHCESYGFRDGLLEIWVMSDAEPIGGVTAEECFDKINLAEHERRL